MRTHIAIAVVFLFSAGLLASCAPTRVEMDYGTSHKLQMVNQIANPDAEKNLKPVEGLDGQSAAAAMTKYRKEFEKQEKAPSGVSNLGNTGK
jgi:type IV pilus biogenesis protein CpaD/CtpE